MTASWVRERWVLRADISGGQCEDVGLIAVGLKHSERAVRECVVIGVGADKNDGLASPFIDGRGRHLLFLLCGEWRSETHGDEHKDAAKD